MKKQGFTLMELLLSIILVTVILVTMIGTLLKIRESYSIINQNIEARTYKALVSKVINEHFIKNGGVKYVSCSSNTKCELTLGNNKIMILEIINNNIKSEQVKDSSNAVVATREIQTSTLKYYGNDYEYLKTINQNKLTYTNGTVITDGYSFKKLNEYHYAYPNVKDSNMKDIFYSIIVEISDTKYNIELYSNSKVDYEELKRYYTLTYDNNGGYDCLKELRKDGEPWGPLCIPKTNQSGYSFFGWYNQPSSGTELLDSTIARGNITAYAQWTNRRFTCPAGKYLPKNSTNCAVCLADNYCPGVDNVLFDKFDDQGLIACNSGYHSASGKSSASDCSINCAANTHIVHANDQTCTSCPRGYLISAHSVIQGNTSSCIAQQLTITFNKNDGSNSKVSKTYIYDGNMDDDFLESNDNYNKRTGYSFKGWSFKADGSDNIRYSFNSVLGDDWFISQVGNRPTTSINLYAIWESNTYLITLDNQSATTSGTQIIYEQYNTGYYLDENKTKKMTTSANGITVPTRTGYSFDGYYTGTNGSGTKYISADGKLTSNASLTNFTVDGALYAKWIGNEITLANKTITKTYSASIQSDTIGPATNGTGSYTYTITSGNSSNYFSITNGTLNIASKTPVGTYTLTIKATDTGSAKTDTATYTVTINAKVLTVSITSCTSKTYDKTATAACTITVQTAESNDSVTASGNCSYNNATVGNNKTASCNNISLSGASSRNYTLSSTSASKANAGNITAKGLTVSLSCNNKEYNANDSASCTGSVTPLTGDSVSVSTSSCKFNNKNVGNSKTVTCTISKSGSDSGNYSIATSATGSANITAKSLTVSLSCNNKTYNTTNTASCTGSVTPLTGDSVSVSASSCTFDNANAGSNKAVSCTISKSGTDKDNYSIATTASSTATISKFDISSGTIGSVSAQNYSGSEIKPTPSVSVTINGSSKTLTVTTEYTYSYTSNTNPTNAAKVTATGTGNYKGTLTQTFTIKPKVTFNANSGSGTMNAQHVSYNSATTLTQNAFTRSGYTFNGWNTKDNGSGTAYADKASITTTSNVTLYAQWKASCTSATHTYDESTGKCTYTAIITQYRCSATGKQSCKTVSCGNGIGSCETYNVTCPSGYYQSDLGDSWIYCCTYECPNGTNQTTSTCFNYVSSTSCSTGYSNPRASKWACESTDHTLNTSTYICSYTP